MVKGQGSVNFTLWAEVKGIMSFIVPVRCLQEAGETALGIHVVNLTMHVCLFIHTVKPRSEAHLDMILFEVFLKNIHLIPQDQIVQ